MTTMLKNLSRNILKLFSVVILTTALSSCARHTVMVPPTASVPPSNPIISLPPSDVMPVPLPPSLTPTVLMPSMPATFTRTDIVHTIGPGETLWRISKMYDVSVDDIKSTNRISDAGQLVMGTKLKVPNAAPIKSVIALYPSEKWKYIIIHHSATEEGDSLSFHHAHLKKGWDKGVGYHFVIDNGSSGKQSGQIEATPRWIKQLDGAHCKASDMNIRAIGICLVGNFNNELPTEKQFASLVYLVNTLAKYYHIPKDHIIGHGRVAGAQTDCPGSRFPMSKLKNKINP